MKKLAFVTCFEIRGYPPLARLFCELNDRKCQFHWVNLETSQFKTIELPSFGNGSSLPYGNGKWQRLYSRLRYFFKLISIHRKNPIDILVVVDSASVMMGLLLRLVLQLPILFIEYDHVENFPGLRGLIQKWGHRKIAALADYLVFPNVARQKRFEAEYTIRGKVSILPNYPLLIESVGVSTVISFEKEQPLELYYHGSFVAERMPLTLLHAMKAFPDCRLKIRAIVPDFPGGDNHLKTFKKLAETLGVHRHIEWLPLKSIEELSSYGVSSQVGIVFFANNGQDAFNQSSMWGASNKIPQFASYGLVILLSTTEKTMIDETKEIAQYCDAQDVGSIVQALKVLIESPDRLNQMRRRARELAITEWTFEQAFTKSPVVEWLKE